MQSFLLVTLVLAQNRRHGQAPLPAWLKLVTQALAQNRRHGQVLELNNFLQELLHDYVETRCG
jgi:hypothetical protein